MIRPLCLSAILLLMGAPANALELPGKPLLNGLKAPQSVAVAEGKVYLIVAGEGQILVLNQGKAAPFATGLDDPRGLVAHQGILFAVDKLQVWRIDRQGKVQVYAPATAFPRLPQLLYGLAVDPESGILYVSDVGDGKGKGAAVFRITPDRKVTLVTDATRWPGLHTPRGLLLEGASHLLVADFGSGDLHRLKLQDGSTEKLAGGLGGPEGLAWDKHGRLFISDSKGGRLLAIPRPGEKPLPLATGFQAPAALCLDPTSKLLLVPDSRAGTLTALSTSIPGAEVDEAPLPLEAAVAFPDLQWTGWKGVNEKGQVNPFRPLVLTHAGDGSNRIFVATQHGVIHVFPNDQKAVKTQVFLDIQERVRYTDKENEEGFLGLAFPPHYRKTGEFYAFYTLRNAKLTNVVSRFRVLGDDPNRADPASEEVILRIEHPFWNHDGGTICFGPDGYLYIAVGDGGSANDPFDNGQNLKTLLGKVLRLDVDHKDPGKSYAIPRDNPFVGQKDARPEIWAYGLRNVWRMAFDRKTGKLWAGDVGQNLYEEIDLLQAGGNFGWNRREGLHPFGVKGIGPRKELIDPIWEYHHDVGKSITGGSVYRGSRLPELEGAYLYGDYVTNKIWALRYDETHKRVVANRPLRDRGAPILSFGEDEQGEIYLLTYTSTGKGIYGFVRSAK